MMFSRFRIFTCALVASFILASASAADLDGRTWRVTLHSGNLGPVEMHLALSERDGVIHGHSVSGALEEIRKLPGAQADDVSLEVGLFAFAARQTEEGYVGTMAAPWSGDEIRFGVDENGRISGSLEGWLLGGDFAGEQVDGTAALRDYPALWRSIEQVTAAKIFQPKDLESDAYRLFRRRMTAISERAIDDLDLLIGFRFGWTNDPFSHLELRRSDVSAEEMFSSLDDLRIGRESAHVSFDGDVAILRVDTMMGNDTIEQIDAAYEAIAKAGSKVLVIDLVGNGGGAFAVKPLVEHVIDEPMDAGYFVSQKWNVAHEELPTGEQLQTVEPWSGWKLSAFWRDVQQMGLMRLRFFPAEPNFNGPVFVAVDKRSASATELAADALRSSGLVTLVGETTAGEMLSQSLFDAGDGFLVSVPVADYASAANGRIEGVGVPVDVAARSSQALETAKRLALELIRK